MPDAFLASIPKLIIHLLFSSNIDSHLNNLHLVLQRFILLSSSKEKVHLTNIDLFLFFKEAEKFVLPLLSIILKYQFVNERIQIIIHCIVCSSQNFAIWNDHITFCEQNNIDLSFLFYSAEVIPKTTNYTHHLHLFNFNTNILTSSYPSLQLLKLNLNQNSYPFYNILVRHLPQLCIVKLKFTNHFLSRQQLTGLATFTDQFCSTLQHLSISCYLSNLKNDINTISCSLKRSSYPNIKSFIFNTLSHQMTSSVDASVTNFLKKFSFVDSVELELGSIWLHSDSSLLKNVNYTKISHNHNPQLVTNFISHLPRIKFIDFTLTENLKYNENDAKTIQSALPSCQHLTQFKFNRLHIPFNVIIYSNLSHLSSIDLYHQSSFSANEMKILLDCSLPFLEKFSSPIMQDSDGFYYLVGFLFKNQSKFIKLQIGVISSHLESRSERQNINLLALRFFNDTFMPYLIDLRLVCDIYHASHLIPILNSQFPVLKRYKMYFTPSVSRSKIITFIDDNLFRFIIYDKTHFPYLCNFDVYLVVVIRSPLKPSQKTQILNFIYHIEAQWKNKERFEALLTELKVLLSF